jgi:hypothetical protein
MTPRKLEEMLRRLGRQAVTARNSKGKVPERAHQKIGVCITPVFF